MVELTTTEGRIEALVHDSLKVEELVKEVKRLQKITGKSAYFADQSGSILLIPTPNCVLGPATELLPSTSQGPPTLTAYKWLGAYQNPPDNMAFPLPQAEARDRARANSVDESLRKRIDEYAEINDIRWDHHKHCTSTGHRLDPFLL